MQLHVNIAGLWSACIGYTLCMIFKLFWHYLFTDMWDLFFIIISNLCSNPYVCCFTYFGYFSTVGCFWDLGWVALDLGSLPSLEIYLLYVWWQHWSSELSLHQWSAIFWRFFNTSIHSNPPHIGPRKNVSWAPVALVGPNQADLSLWYSVIGNFA